MKKFFSNKANLLVLALVVVIVALLVILYLAGSARWAIWVLAALIVFGVLWIAIELWQKAKKRRRQRRFDEDLAAKEGIDERKREWSERVAELEKQGIDRYELPFYVLVGEPQSGKSILLQNSDLHFPFGQTRLSGAGGTRGCDWWFTEEAVILDLAGRLFTHEGGVADEKEWQAFLDLLFEFRPLCPANGILLVLPCDGLLVDQRDSVLHKASKMQDALVTLSNKLQAQLPVYLVLTKGDKIFGFAESVYRLEQAQRQQMFGWSRPGERFDAPFKVEEAREGFDELVQRARLLRAEMMATAALPEDIAAVHRMSAFPEELRALWPGLELYLKTLFTDSAITEKLFLRGLYLTSGLQSGVPVAKVCAELIGGAREADSRALESLFTKQRAYFIRDLVRDKVFAERGLVKPTSSRVVKARRAAAIGYGFAGAVALTALATAVVFAVTHESDLASTPAGNALVAGWDEVAARGPLDLSRALDHLETLRQEAAHVEQDTIGQKADALLELHGTILSHRVLPHLRDTVIASLDRPAKDSAESHEEFRARVTLALDLADTVQYRAPEFARGNDSLAGRVRTRLDALGLGDALLTRIATELAAHSAVGEARREDQKPAYATLFAALRKQLDRTLEAGDPLQVGGDLGWVVAVRGVERSERELSSRGGVRSEEVHRLAAHYHACLGTARRAREALEGGFKPERAESALEALRQLRLALSTGSDEGGAWPSAALDLEPAKLKTFKPSADAEKAIDKDESRRTLEEICDPALLPLAPWSLDGLARDIRRAWVDLRPDNTQRDVRDAKLKAVSAAFADAVASWDDLRRPEVIAAEADGGDAALAQDALALLAELDNVTIDVGRLRTALGRALSGFVEGPALDRLAASDETRAIQTLVRASTARHAGLDESARRRLDRLIGDAQKGVLEGWQASAPSDTSYRAVAQLLLDFIRFEDRVNPGPSELPAGLAQRDRWLAEVDAFVKSRIEAARAAARERLREELRIGSRPLSEWKGELARELEEERLARWAQAGARDSGVQLEERDLARLGLLPTSVPLVNELFVSLRAGVAPDMAGQPVVKHTREALRDFELGSDDKLANSLATARARRAELGGGVAAGATQLAVVRANEIWDLFDTQVRLELRRKFTSELDNLLTTSGELSRALFTASWSDLEGASRGTPALYEALAQQLRKTFAIDGDLDRLRQRYRLADLGDLSFPSTPADQPTWTRFQFLRDVQRFLLARDVFGAAPGLPVRWTVVRSGADSITANKDNGNVLRASFARDSSGAWVLDEGKETLVTDKDTAPQPWNLREATGPLALRFTSKRTAARQLAPTEVELVVHGVLAPLVLAWSAEPKGDEWELSIPVERLESFKRPGADTSKLLDRRITLRLAFPQDPAATAAPLPRRPAK